jgi:hypothetical protein
MNWVVLGAAGEAVGALPGLSAERAFFDVYKCDAGVREAKLLD